MRREKSTYLTTALVVLMSSLFAQCPNFDFENGDFSNWKGRIGCPRLGISINFGCPSYGYNGIDPIQGTDGDLSQHEIITPAFNSGSARDPYATPLRLISPFGGTRVARVGNYTAATLLGANPNQAQGAELTYELTVDSSNILVQLAYAIVLTNPAGHSNAERPYFSIRVLDPGGQSIQCMEYEVVGRGNTPGFRTFGNYVWRDWTIGSIYLGNYIGQKVTIQVQTSDCEPAAHPGWGYIDAQCDSLGLISSEPTTCGGKFITLTAPSGLSRYEWHYGSPGGPVVSTLQSFSTDKPGTYYCTMVPFTTSNSECPFTLSIDIGEAPGTPAADFLATPDPTCLGEPTKFKDLTTVDPGQNIVSWAWNFGDSSATVTQKNPSHTFPDAGIYDVQLVVTSNTGCIDTVIKPVEILPHITPKITPVGPFCSSDDPVQLEVDTLGGTWSGPGVDAGGLFTPLVAAASGQPVHITYVIGECEDSASIDIMVYEQKDPQIDPQEPFCTSSDPFQMSANIPNGVWFCSMGNYDPETGVFIPDSSLVPPPGETAQIEVQYIFDEFCFAADTMEMTVFRQKDATITHPGSFCPKDTLVILAAGDEGGTWQGPGIINPIAGHFNPGQANLGGNQIIYGIEDMCPTADSIIIQVQSNPDATFSLPKSVCTSVDPFPIDAVTAGGTWSGPGIANPDQGMFDPDAAGPGTHTVTYTFDGECGDEHQEEIEVILQKDATILNNPSLCPKDAPVQLLAQDAGGVWSGTGITNSGTGMFDPAVAGIGEHTITYTISGQCGDVDQVTIKVNDFLDATITQVDTLCNSDTPFTMNAVDPGGIWEGIAVDAQSGVFTPANAVAGNNQVVYSIPGACGSSDTTIVPVLITPQPDVIPVSPVCYNATAVALQGTPANGTWTGTGVTGTYFDPQGLTPDTFRIYYQFAGKCPAVDSTDIVYLPPVKLDQYQQQNVLCSGACDGKIDQITLSGGIGAPYQIAFNPAPSDMSDPNNPKGFCAGPYTMQVTDTNGCQLNMPFSFTEPLPLIFQAKSITAHCGKPDGIAYVKDLQGGTPPYTVLWQGENIQGDTLYGVPGEKMYNALVTDANGCSKSQSVMVPDTPGPQFDVNTTAVSCFGYSDGMAKVENIQDAVPPYSYDWGNGQFGANSVGWSAGTYQVTLKDKHECQNTNVFTILEPESVTIHPDFTDSTICDGGQVTPWALAIGGNGAPYTYYWTEPATQYQVQGSMTLDRPAVLEVFAVDPLGCYSDTAVVNIDQLPPLSLVVEPDTTICEGDSVLFQAWVNGGNPLSHSIQWSISNSSNSQVWWTPTGGYGNPQQVSVVLEDGCSTPTNDVAGIQFHEPPHPDFVAAPREGCEPLQTVLQSTSTNVADLRWTINGKKIPAGDMFAQTFNSGLYDVTLETWSPAGCYAVKSEPAYIESYPLPIAKFDWLPTDPTYMENIVSFNNHSLGIIDQSRWKITDRYGDVFATSNRFNPTVDFPADTGLFYIDLHVTTDHGCVDSLQKRLRIKNTILFYAPNSITVNGDGINEYFSVHISGHREQDFEVAIFDRWGEEVFYSRDPEFKWNGTIDNVGGEPKPDVYAWVVKVRDLMGIKHTYRGHITVIK